MFRDVENPELDLHFNTPIVIGGPNKNAFEQPLIPGPLINSKRAAQPENPGFVPLPHQSIQPMLDRYQLEVPYRKANASYEETLGNVSQLFSEVSFEDDVLAEAAEEVSFAQSVEPLFLVVLQLAIILGTLLFLTQDIRYTIVWVSMALIGAFFTLTDRAEALAPVQSADLGWGLGIGFLVGLPILIILRPSLTTVTMALFPEAALAKVILLALITIPLSETLLFRGVVQERRGFLSGVIAAGLSALLIFWPALQDLQVSFAALLIVFLTAMAALYGYVRLRYGLGAALLTQVVVNLLVMVIPTLFI